MSTSDDVSTLVKFLKTPMNAVVSMACTDSTILFGTIDGTFHQHQLAIGPHGKPYFGMQGKELQLNQNGVPIDVIIVSPCGDLAACLVGGNSITFVRNVGPAKPTNNSFGNGAVAGATPPRPGKYGQSSGLTPVQVCTKELQGLQYTSRAASHTWLDDVTLAIGCVDGTVLMLVVDLATEAVVKEDTIIKEDSPIVQLNYESEETQTLCVSTLSRSGFVANVRRDMVFEDASFTQVGVKARIQGLYGGCMNKKTNRIYTARPSRRVFEADAATGTVFKTFKLPECKYELSVLKLVEQYEEEQPEDDVDGPPEVLLLSESPQFLGLVSLRAAGAWRLALPQAERAIVCGMQFQNFFLFLCSDDNVMSLQVGTTPPPTNKAPVGLDTDLPMGVSRTESSRSLNAAVTSSTGNTDPSTPSKQVSSSARTIADEHVDPTVAQLALMRQDTNDSLSSAAAPATEPDNDRATVLANTAEAADFASDEVVVKKVKRPRKATTIEVNQGGSGPSDPASPIAISSSANTSAMSESPISGSPPSYQRADSGLAAPAAKDAETRSNASGGGRRKTIVVKKKIIKTSNGVRTERIVETKTLTTTEGGKTSERTSPVEPEPVASFPTRAPPQPAAAQASESIVEDEKKAMSSPVESAPSPATPTVREETLVPTHSPDSPTHPTDSSVVQQKEEYSAVSTEPEGQGVSAAQPTQPVPEPAVETQEAAPPPSPPPVPEKKPPTALEVFDKDTAEIFATHNAFSLDKKVQPKILAEIIRWADVLRERLDDRNAEDREVAEKTRAYFTTKLERHQVVTLLTDGLEWLTYVPLPEDTDECDIGSLFFRQLERLNLSEDDDACHIYEKVVKAVGALDALAEVARKAAAHCVFLLNDHAFPLLDTLEADTWEMLGEEFSSIEDKIISISPHIAEDLQFHDYSLCLTWHYFPYLFAVLPSKCTQVALATFPSLSIAHIQWCLSGHVQTQAVTALKSCRMEVTRMSSDDLGDCLCDVILCVMHEHQEHILQKTAFVRCIELLLERRHMMLNREGLDATPAAGTPTTRGHQSMPGKPSAISVRKLRRLDDAIMELLRSSKLKLNVAFPELRGLFDKYQFPLGIVELRAIEDSIKDAVTNNRIDRLLPLFQMQDVITEAHWISLFIVAHEGEKLERGVYLCLTVVQQPKKVRYLLRKAFPYIDTPDVNDEQLRGVVEKLSILIN